MQIRRLVVPVLLAASLPATVVLAQAQSPPSAQPQAKGQDQKQHRRPRLSPEARGRLLDGRMAMIKETLKLNDAQLKLWGPVEQHIRTTAAERQKRREEWMQRRQQGAAPPSLPERLDRMTQRLSKRAERLKAFNDVLKPFYASLNDEQKVLARAMLRRHAAFGGRSFFHRRWAQNGGPGPQQPQQRQ